MVAKRTASQEAYEEPMGEEIAPNCYLLSPEEGWRILDERSREDLGMTAEEFVRRLKTGDFSEEQREHVWILRMMVPRGYLK